MKKLLLPMHILLLSLQIVFRQQYYGSIQWWKGKSVVHFSDMYHFVIPIKFLYGNEINLRSVILEKHNKKFF